MFIRLSQFVIALLVGVKLSVFAVDDSHLLAINPFERLERHLGRLVDEIVRHQQEARDRVQRAGRLAAAVRGVRRRAIECWAVLVASLSADLRAVALDGPGDPLPLVCGPTAPAIKGRDMFGVELGDAWLYSDWG